MNSIIAWIDRLIAKRCGVNVEQVRASRDRLRRRAEQLANR